MNSIDTDVRDAQYVASQSLLNTAKSTNTSLGSFSSWLVAGVGAAFSLLLAKLDTISQYVDLRFIRVALLFLVISLIFSVLSRLTSTIVSSALTSHEVTISFMAQFYASGRTFNIEEFIVEFERGLFPYQRWAARRSMRKAKAGDRVAGARLVSKLSQIHALLVIIEASLSVAAAATLVFGLKF